VLYYIAGVARLFCSRAIFEKKFECGPHFKQAIVICEISAK